MLWGFGRVLERDLQNKARPAVRMESDQGRGFCRGSPAAGKPPVLKLWDPTGDVRSPNRGYGTPTGGHETP